MYTVCLNHVVSIFQGLILIIKNLYQELKMAGCLYLITISFGAKVVSVYPIKQNARIVQG